MLKGRAVFAWMLITCFGSVLRAQPRTKELGPEEVYAWQIRAEHAAEILIAVGDSQDVVLLRDRCGADAGHGQKGCWDASTVRVTPRWTIGVPGLARIRPLTKGAWIFGPGTAGARLFGLRPGRAILSATLPSGETVSDSIWIVSAPGAVRIVLEPKPREIVAGDTVRFRVTARDTMDRIVAVLRLPLGWNVVGPPDSLGFTPVAFYPWETGGWLVPRLGRLTDTLELHFIPRGNP